MKTILVLLLFASIALFALLYVIDPVWALHVRVPGYLRDKQFHEARQQCESLRNQKPSLFDAPANARIGAIHLTAAQAEIEKHNYSAAQDWLNGLFKRTGPPTGGEAKAGHLLKELPGLHYQQAHALWLQKDYEPALAEFEEIERLYKDDPILARARPEACLVEVELAKQLNDAGDPEAALDRLSKLQAPHLPPHMVKAAWRAVPDLGEKAIQGRLERGEYEAAFALLEGLDDRFPGDPELYSRLKDLRARIDLQLFQIALEDPTRRRQCATALSPEAPPDEKAVLNIQNESQYPLRLIYVGPQRVEITVPAQATRKVELAPGRYLTGVYSPETRKFRPSRQQMIFRAGAYVEKLFRPAPPPPKDVA